MRKWQRRLMALSPLLIVVAAASSLYWMNTHQPKPTSTPKAQTQSSAPGKETTPKVPATPTTPQADLYYYPMTGYASRVTFRYYGLYVTPSQKASPCGASFTGYHDGDDLEVTSAEINADVPVYAITAGTVKELNYVSGYGGLLVLGTNINGSDYTVYYGHINLASAAVTLGDSVTSGQKLANLGAECSLQTDGERKHLHFAVHKGSSIDVRGYAPSLAELHSWVNPTEFLKSLGAR